MTYRGLGSHVGTLCVSVGTNRRRRRRSAWSAGAASQNDGKTLLRVADSDELESLRVALRRLVRVCDSDQTQ